MKTVLAIVSLCFACQAHAATYLLLSKTNDFANGITANATNSAKAYTDAHAGGGTNWTLAGNILVASNAVSALVGDQTLGTNFGQLFALPGSYSGLTLGDGTDVITILADSAHSSYGSGVFLNGAPIGGDTIWTTNASGVIAPLGTGQLTNVLRFTSGLADNATNRAVVINTASTWSANDQEKLLTLQNNSTNVAYFTQWGALNIGRSVVDYWGPSKSDGVVVVHDISKGESATTYINGTVIDSTADFYDAYFTLRARASATTPSVRFDLSAYDGTTTGGLKMEPTAGSADIPYILNTFFSRNNSSAVPQLLMVRNRGTNEFSVIYDGSLTTGGNTNRWILGGVTNGALDVVVDANHHGLALVPENGNVLFTNRFTGDGYTSSASPWTNAARLTLYGEDPATSELSLTYYDYGADIFFKHPSNQLEFHSLRGGSPAALATIVNGSGQIQWQVRDFTDSNSLMMFYPSAGDPGITTEASNQSWKLTANGSGEVYTDKNFSAPSLVATNYASIGSTNRWILGGATNGAPDVSVDGTHYALASVPSPSWTQVTPDGTNAVINLAGALAGMAKNFYYALSTSNYIIFSNLVVGAEGTIAINCSGTPQQVNFSSSYDNFSTNEIAPVFSITNRAIIAYKVGWGTDATNVMLGIKKK